MLSDMSIGNRMLVACSVVVLLFSSTFLLVGLSLSNLTENVQQIREQILPLLTKETEIAGRSGVAHQLANETEGFASDIKKSYGEQAKFRELQLAEANNVVVGMLDASRSTMNLMIVGGVISALMAAVFGVWIVLGVREQLGGEPAYAKEVVSSVAEGDLTVRVQTHINDTSSLLYAVKGMVANLTDICIEVRTNSEFISSATQEVASGNAELSQRTEEQAASLQETTSSMAELLTNVRGNAETAQQANKLAQGTCKVAEDSGQLVERLVETMDGINASSRKIENIISVIDGIAFQTNILALNAAVEAARAGEQGRGFAVVAGEVRNLAQRSAMAAKEIKQLIGDSVGKVHIGTSQVKEAAEGIGDVVTSVELLASLMKEISTATAEQSVSIDQINTAITQMDEVTQQNAALVEQDAAAAESMQEQAVALMRAVSLFKLEMDNSPKVPRSRASTAAKEISTGITPVRSRRSRLSSSEGKDEWKEF